jgi:4'-phosphopantetheinyl transferase
MTLTPDNSRSAVRVWHATSSSDQPGPIEACCESWLDDSDRQRASRFRRLTTRNQHVIGRGMARRLLGSDLVLPQSIRFEAHVYGKPFVAEPDEAKRPFNVAHTDGLVMCGIGDEQHEMIGIDVERLDRRTDPELADRYFSEPEVRYLNAHRCAEARGNAFLRIWTLKESFIKAIGTGLQTPLADFAFEQIDSDSPSIRMLNPKLESNTSWSFYSFEPRDGFIAAVAVASKQATPRIEVELHSFDKLITDVQ